MIWFRITAIATRIGNIWIADFPMAIFTACTRKWWHFRISAHSRNFGKPLHFTYPTKTQKQRSNRQFTPNIEVEEFCQKKISEKNQNKSLINRLSSSLALPVFGMNFENWYRPINGPIPTIGITTEFALYTELFHCNGNDEHGWFIHRWNQWNGFYGLTLIWVFPRGRV